MDRFKFRRKLIQLCVIRAISPNEFIRNGFPHQKYDFKKLPALSLKFIIRDFTAMHPTTLPLNKFFEGDLIIGV